MQFEDKFIAFIDVLGFKDMVDKAESGTGMSLQEVLQLLSCLGTSEDSSKFLKYGHTTCPDSIAIRKDLNFKVTQISDCVIVSSEVSPAGVINLVSHCWSAVFKLLMKGIMCRGYITRGSIFHTDGQVIGTGYQNAYSKESRVTAFKIEADERGTPFVEIDSIVNEYVASSGDSCVQEMYSRMVKTVDGLTALFPFKRLSHSFVISSFEVNNFDPEKEKDSNNNVRLLLRQIIERIGIFVDRDNAGAIRKSQHYVRSLNEQLLLCDKMDEEIDMLCQPIRGNR